MSAPPPRLPSAPRACSGPGWLCLHPTAEEIPWQGLSCCNLEPDVVMESILWAAAIDFLF